MSTECPPYNKYNTCFPGIIDTDQTCVRYTNKETSGNEQYLFSNYYREQINQYGTQITYFVNAFTSPKSNRHWKPSKSDSSARSIF